MESVVGNLLRAGVILAATVVAVGGVLYLVRYGAAQPGQRVFLGQPADSRSVSGIVLDVKYVAVTLIVLAGLLFSLIHL